jgi:hypothetical protein
VGAVSGNVVVESAPGEAGTPLEVGAVVAPGQWVHLGTDARVTVNFEDGAVMDVAGPALFRMTVVSDYSRTIDLVNGTVNRFDAKDITTGLRTPFDTYVVLRESSGFAKVESTPDSWVITYSLWSGNEAKVVDERRLLALDADRPIVIERPKGAGAGMTEEPGATVGETETIVLGVHTIEYTPKAGFLVEPTDAGGVRLTSKVATGQFGVVTVDGQKTFYLAPEDVIEFDADGNIVRYTGIVHVYAALDLRGIYDEAVADPSDASPIGTRTR